MFSYSDRKHARSSIIHGGDCVWIAGTIHP